MSSNLSTAIVMIIFKRPSQTERVFKMIADARPSRLYIVADGPRNSEEALICNQTRQIVEHIDWDCKVQRNYSEINLGLRNRVISGLDWVFQHEESAIILEDDCLPHPTFFSFCDELLKYYKDDDSVMHISGDNFLQEKLALAQSYYFSKYAHIWGWATWRRAWSLFHKWDLDLSNMELDFRIFPTPSERNFWRGLLKQFRSHQMTYTWDYQWALTCLAHKALCVMPESNLVSNIGFGAEATHTRDKNWLANLSSSPIEFPLNHPPQKVWDSSADRYSAKIFFSAKPVSWTDFYRAALRRLTAGVQKLKGHYEV